MPIFDHKSRTAWLDLQTVSGKSTMHVLPGLCGFQGSQKGFALIAGEALKRLLAGMGFKGRSPLINSRWLVL